MLNFAVASLLFCVTAGSMALLAARRRTLPPMMTSGIAFVGFSAGLLGAALFEDAPCEPNQLLLRAATLGLGMAFVIWSMLRKRTGHVRHGEGDHGDPEAGSA